MNWYNEPPRWSAQGRRLTVGAGAQTDFWRLTYSGLINDNGHFYYEPCPGNFAAEVKISGHYNTLYDQAGLMIRVDERNWIKCGIEFLDGVQHVSAVITHDYSDWSMVPLPSNPPTLWLRLQRQEATVEVYYSLDGEHFQLLRQGFLPLAETVQVGLMCAAPIGTGFTVTFDDFTIQNMEAHPPK